MKDWLSKTYDGTNLGLDGFHRGKVRNSYVVNDNRIMVVTDRVSVFDRVVGLVPFKGQVLNALSCWWFRILESHAPGMTHFRWKIDPAVGEFQQCKPIKVEMIVRGYLTGSAWRHYETGGRELSGVKLPDGLTKNAKFPDPIITPTTKAEDGEHDAPISAKEILEQGLATSEQYAEMTNIALQAFDIGVEVAERNGLILVDTKYEMGLDKFGLVTLIDEAHTSDSSRYWHKTSYKQDPESPRPLDKDFVRNWFAERGFMGDGPAPEMTDEFRIEAAKRYFELYETLTGLKFEPDLQDPEERIRQSLKKAGY